MPEHQIPTRIAVRLARLNRLKLNEAISKGWLKGMNMPGKGTTRLFTLNQVIALHVFADLLAIPMKAIQAARIASNVLVILNTNPAEERLNVSMSPAAGLVMTLHVGNIRRAIADDLKKLTNPPVSPEPA